MSKTIGIIAEYNPFHNGHKAQIKYARNELKADYIVVALSSDFTQRGNIAFMSKYKRAKAALMNDVDLVIEIPAIYSCASAEYYAKAGINLLNATGIVDAILFSGESDNMDYYEDVTNIIVKDSKKYNSIIKKRLETGISYPVARKDAIINMMHDINDYTENDLVEFLDSPNNILGIEYIKAIKKYAPDMKYYCMKRIGDPYHSTEIISKYASASAIRNTVYKDSIEACHDSIPDDIIDLYDELVDKDEIMHPNDISLLLHNKLLEIYISSNYDKDVFKQYLDCDKDLSRKIVKNLYNFTEFLSFVELLKSKNYTFTRISRVLCHILLDIKDEYFDTKCPTLYIYVLGVKEDSIKLLNKINKKSTVPVFTSKKDQEEQMKLEMNVINDMSYYILHSLLTNKTHKSYHNEIERKFLKV